MLWLTDQAFSILELVDRLFMSLIGKMISSMVISLVRKFRTIPSSLSVLTPKMRSNAGLVRVFDHTLQHQVLLCIPCCWSIQQILMLRCLFLWCGSTHLTYAQTLAPAYSSRENAFWFPFHGTCGHHQTLCLMGLSKSCFCDPGKVFEFCQGLISGC